MPRSPLILILIYLAVVASIYYWRTKAAPQHRATLTALLSVFRLIGFMFLGIRLGLFILAKVSPPRDPIIAVILPNLTGILIAAVLGALFGAFCHFMLGAVMKIYESDPDAE